MLTKVPKQNAGKNVKSPNIRGKGQGTFAAKTTAIQCREGNHKPTVRLNVVKPSSIRTLDDRALEERSSLEDFQLPVKKTPVQPKPKPTPTATVTSAQVHATYDDAPRFVAPVGDGQSNKVNFDYTDTPYDLQ